MSIPSITNPGFEDGTLPWAGSIAQSNTYVHEGSWSGAILTNDSTVTGYQDISWDANYQSGTFTFQMYTRGRSSIASNGKLGIYDGLTTTYGDAYMGASFTLVTVTKKLAYNATGLRLICWASSAQEQVETTSFDDATLTATLYKGQRVIFII
uniref:Tail protein n=1 Tax=viral metagenome TaxID=1070528 RepID=A0A6H2A3S9_9ZZZZ